MVPPSFYDRHLFTFGESSIGASDSDHRQIVTIGKERGGESRSWICLGIYVCVTLLYLPKGREGGAVKDKSDAIGDQTNDI